MTAPRTAPTENRAGPSPQLDRLANQVAGRHWRSASPESLASLLLPIVRRAAQTGRGPTALLRWVDRGDRSDPRAVADRAARTLAANLVRLLLEPRDVQRDTVRY